MPNETIVIKDYLAGEIFGSVIHELVNRNHYFLPDSRDVHKKFYEGFRKAFKEYPEIMDCFDCGLYLNNAKKVDYMLKEFKRRGIIKENGEISERKLHLLEKRAIESEELREVASYICDEMGV